MYYKYSCKKIKTLLIGDGLAEYQIISVLKQSGLASAL